MHIMSKQVLLTVIPGVLLRNLIVASTGYRLMTKMLFTLLCLCVCCVDSWAQTTTSVGNQRSESTHRLDLEVIPTIYPASKPSGFPVTDTMVSTAPSLCTSSAAGSVVLDNPWEHTTCLLVKISNPFGIKDHAYLDSWKQPPTLGQAIQVGVAFAF